MKNIPSLFPAVKLTKILIKEPVEVGAFGAVMMTLGDGYAGGIGLSSPTNRGYFSFVQIPDQKGEQAIIAITHDPNCEFEREAKRLIDNFINSIHPGQDPHIVGFWMMKWYDPDSNRIQFSRPEYKDNITAAGLIGLHYAIWGLQRVFNWQIIE
jgi:hypothetical protein